MKGGVYRMLTVEVHYRMRGKWYFAVGFKNRKGGLEIRNPYFMRFPQRISHMSVIMPGIDGSHRYWSSRGSWTISRTWP